MSIKKIVKVFLIAFILNIVWENLHSLLYSNYMGGNITEFILIRASLFDALVITLTCLPFFSLKFFKKRTWLILIVGLIIAIFNEKFALNTNRWSYNQLMPIIPFINTGLTPTIQLSLLGYLSLVIMTYDHRHRINPKQIWFWQNCRK